MIVGLGVVFLGLVLLIGIVKLVGLICGAAFKRGKKPAEPSTSAPAAKNTGFAPRELTEAQRGELIAAISAVIAEDMGKPVSGIRIRSIHRVG